MLKELDCTMQESSWIFSNVDPAGGCASSLTGAETDTGQARVSFMSMTELRERNVPVMCVALQIQRWKEIVLALRQLSEWWGR